MNTIARESEKERNDKKSGHPKGKGGCDMTKRMVMGLLALLVGLAGAGKAWADADDQDSLTITVAPNVNYSIDLTTTNTSLALGAVDLGNSTFTVVPATVTFGGTVYTGHECDLTAAISHGGGGTAWGFDTTPATGTNISAEADRLAMYATFSSTNLATVPSGDNFADARYAVSDGDGNSLYGPTRVGAAGNGGGPGADAFEYNAATMALGLKDMDSAQVASGSTNSEQAHVWFFLRLPSATTSGGAQNIQVTLTHTLGAL
jgi:hypothetical protein